MRFEFTAAALQELDDAVSYYNQQCSGLGRAFTVEIAKAVEQIIALHTLGACSTNARELGAFASTDSLMDSSMRSKVTSL